MSTYDAFVKMLKTSQESSARETFSTGSLGGKAAGTETFSTEERAIPVGVSNRHIHLSQKDVDALFGTGYTLQVLKPLAQPGQFGCKETLNICGPKGAIEKVRVLGPVRSKTQVEVLAGDAYKLGVMAPTRMSGDLKDSPGITLIGPKGSVQAPEGLIVAQRHIHMSLGDAKHFGVRNGQIVDVKLDGPRGGIFSNVAIRAAEDAALEFHVDIEESNAMNINSKSRIKIIK